MDRRLLLLIGVLLGGAVGGGATYWVQARDTSERAWRWAESVPEDLDELRVTKAGWRPLGAISSGAGGEIRWAWMVRLANPTDETWRGHVGVAMALEDPVGLQLARSSKGQRELSVPPRDSTTIFQRSSASPQMLTEVEQAALLLGSRVSCLERISYDSLVARIGEEAAQARRETPPGYADILQDLDVDLPESSRRYCFGSRSDRTRLSIQ